jgi:2-oxoglutarate ferredoxin oxidoreductase subunit alpha
VLYDEPLGLDILRDDLVFYAVPYDKLVAPVCPEAKLRKLVKNMIYVGVVAKTARNRYGRSREGHPQAVCQEGESREPESGGSAGRLRLRHRQPHQARSLFIQRMTRPRARSSSTATPPPRWAACSRAHGRAWYPITPSSSLPETMIEYMKRFRIGADGKATFAIVQAEDELAAIGMVIGAGWAGARAMTRPPDPAFR